jgi:cyclopropane fatty-acyl-phospholipid synthase-like methyltransferase
VSRDQILDGVTYQNNYHYQSDGWHGEPKRISVRLADIIEEAKFASGQRLLDVGCASGEFLGYIRRRFSNFDLTGLDVCSLSLDEARRLAPYAFFVEGSALDIPSSLHGGFDIVTGVGVVGIFDEEELKHYLDNMFQCVRQGGVVSIC